MKPVILVLALFSTLALAGCGDDPAGTDPTPAPASPSTDPSPTPAADDSLPADAFVRVSGNMTDANGVTLHVVLTVNQPGTAASLAALDSAVRACPFYADERAHNDALGDAPYLGTGTLVVTGPGTWNRDQPVMISTGGEWMVGTGDATVFDNEDICATNVTHAGTSSLATYYPTLNFEGGIEGALNWGTFGFGDQGDGGGVTYADCSFELSPYAQRLSPGEANWNPQNVTDAHGCFMASDNNP